MDGITHSSHCERSLGDDDQPIRQTRSGSGVDISGRCVGQSPRTLSLGPAIGMADHFHVDEY
jgi:hypothetical protein